MGELIKPEVYNEMANLRDLLDRLSNGEGSVIHSLVSYENVPLVNWLCNMLGATDSSKLELPATLCIGYGHALAAKGFIHEDDMDTFIDEVSRLKQYIIDNNCYKDEETATATE